MKQFLPGELVRIVHFAVNKSKHHPLQGQLGIVIEEQRGTGLYRVMLMGEGGNNQIFRYSSTILRKVSDLQEPPRINS